MYISLSLHITLCDVCVFFFDVKKQGRLASSLNIHLKEIYYGKLFADQNENYLKNYK